MLRLPPAVLILASACSLGGTAPTSSSPAAVSPPVTDLAPATPAAPRPETTATTATSTTITTTTTTTTTTLPWDPLSDRRGVGLPPGSVTGLVMFRGNPTRTFYGRGPVPWAPEIVWRYPDSAMCGNSTHHHQPKVWCGTGWTGQPVIWERSDGITEVIFGAYDKSVHFVDAATGTATRPSFPTGDIVKGSGTLDPDGYPLLYFGSRDNEFRILALDRDVPTELWSMNAYRNPIIWNDDWDSNPAILDDFLFEGGENGWFYVVKLNRGFDGDGMVVVDPEVVVEMQGWTDELYRLVGRNQSIESSVALFEGRAYWANSGGRVVGVDVRRVASGDAPIVFDYWVGDDVDATIVIDGEGMLYVAAELERHNSRSAEVGQIIKLDPYTDGDPLLWSVAVPPTGDEGGVYATPALGDGFLYVATHGGELLAVRTSNGEVTWSDAIGWHAWSSPVVVDGQLVVSVDCGGGGGLRGYRLTNPAHPVIAWQVDLRSGCIESTPAIWKGRIYVGDRAGYFYAFGDPVVEAAGELGLGS